MARIQLSDLNEKVKAQVMAKLDAAPKPKKKVSIPRAPSPGEASLGLALRALGIESEAEYKFCETRKWRFDRAVPKAKFAIEIEGVTHEGGRHQRLDGFQKDILKYEAAMLDGWTVYRCTTAMVMNGQALQTIVVMLARLLGEDRNTNENTGILKRDT